MTRKKRPIPKGRRHLYRRCDKLRDLHPMERLVVDLMQAKAGKPQDSTSLYFALVGSAISPPHRMSSGERFIDDVLADLAYRGLVAADDAGWYRLTAPASEEATDDD